MDRNSILLLKEILECLTGIAGARNVLGGKAAGPAAGRPTEQYPFQSWCEIRRVCNRCAGPCGGCVSGIGLHAFKPRGRIKNKRIACRSAARKGALRALAFRIESRLQNGAAIGTSCASDRAHHGAVSAVRSVLDGDGLRAGRFSFFWGFSALM